MLNPMDYTVDEIRAELDERGDVYVGAYATYSIGSDSYPFEITHVSDSKKTIELRELKATPTDLCDLPYGHQDYTYSSYEEENHGRTLKATLRKDGKYRVTGSRRGGNVHVGHARAYRDPHF